MDTNDLIANENAIELLSSIRLTRQRKQSIKIPNIVMRMCWFQSAPKMLLQKHSRTWTRSFSASASAPASATLESNHSSPTLEEIVTLCRHRGFVFPGSDLYGGFANSYDYGPLGSQMKKNLVDLWWRDFITRRTDCLGFDSSILLNPRVWHTSGHVHQFTDPMTVCASCHTRHRADKLLDEDVDNLTLEELDEKIATLACPTCHSSNTLQKTKHFNLLFQTSVGATSAQQQSSSEEEEEEAGSRAGSGSSTIYLRPETAQGVYINFQHATMSSRKPLPLGLGQVGKSFRNEISPGQFLFRTREFEQMELQYFVKPEESTKYFQEWEHTCLSWLTSALGLDPTRLRLRKHTTTELAHYANATTDIEFKFPFGWGELWGVSDRGSFDLTSHGAGSNNAGFGVYTDPQTQERYVPSVIEPSVGIGRLMLAIFTCALETEMSSTNASDARRTVLRLHPSIAPYQLAVLPLSKKPHLLSLAKELYQDLTGSSSSSSSHKGLNVDYDVSGSIGRRYRRQDEIGTPVCITVDFDSLDDQCVTLRARDSMAQRRISIAELTHVTFDLHRVFNDLNHVSV